MNLRTEFMHYSQKMDQFQLLSNEINAFDAGSGKYINLYYKNKKKYIKYHPFDFLFNGGLPATICDLLILKPLFMYKMYRMYMSNLPLTPAFFQNVLYAIVLTSRT